MLTLLSLLACAPGSVDTADTDRVLQLDCGYSSVDDAWLSEAIPDEYAEGITYNADHTGLELPNAYIGAEMFNVNDDSTVETEYIVNWLVELLPTERYSIYDWDCRVWLVPHD